MKIKRINNKKTVVTISLIVIVIVCGSLLYWANANSRISQSSSTSDPKRSDSDTVQSDNLNNQPDNKEDPVNTDSPQSPSEDPVSGKQIVQVVASDNIFDGTLYIRGGINNAVVYEGSCYALLSGPAGENIRKDTDLLQNPSTTDCKTISINTNNLSKGQWSYKLIFESSNKKGESGEDTFQIQ